MCRLLGYLGPSISLDCLLNKPEHSLIVQSYQPREMTAGLLNADGFGIGWYHPQRDTTPFTYKNILPIWNDPNLSSLNRYLSSAVRDVALTLSAALCAGAAAGVHGPSAALAAARDRFAEGTGAELDYLVLTDPDLGPAPAHGPARMLVAAKVGATRLIDNVPLDLAS